MDPQELRRLRKILGLSTRTVAQAIGVSHVSVWRWEMGTRKTRPALAKLLQLYFRGRVLGRHRLRIEDAVESHDEPLTSRIAVRVTERQMARLKRMASKANLSLAETVRATLNTLPESVPSLRATDPIGEPELLE